MGHEVTLIEQRRDRFERARGEVRPGRAARRRDGDPRARARRDRPTRPTSCFAVTGDDEDNLVIAQIAKEGYGVPKAIARVNDPRNQQHFDLLGIAQTVCATSGILGLVEHEVPEHGLVRLLELRQEGLEVVEMQIAGDSPGGRQAGRRALAAGGRAARLGDAQRRRRDRGRADGDPPGRPGDRDPQARARGQPAARARRLTLDQTRQ